MSSLRSLVPVAATMALLACSGDDGAPPAQRAIPLERAFLEGIGGDWTGTLRETPALQKRVTREMPIRLVVEPGDAPTVEYPTLGCRAQLAPVQNASPPSTETTLRLFQNVAQPRVGTPCQPGPVRLVRSPDQPDVLEFAWLGDTLRRIQATLRKTP